VEWTIEMEKIKLAARVAGEGGVTIMVEVNLPALVTALSMKEWREGMKRSWPRFP
jgi:hypothetical protein